MNKKGLNQSVTYFVFRVLRIIISIFGVLFIIKGIFELNSYIFLGIAMLILSGYMKFKYKVRKTKHQLER